MGPNSHVLLSSTVSRPNFTGLFRCRSPVFPILDTLTRFGDIRYENLKLYKIALNFAFFGPMFFFEAPPEFWDLIIKRTQFSFIYCTTVSQRDFL